MELVTEWGWTHEEIIPGGEEKSPPKPGLGVMLCMESVHPDPPLA